MSLVYLDTSVALAHLLGEDVAPPERLWDEHLVSSRLLAYELWIRLDAMGLRESHGAVARELLSRVSTLELAGPIVEGAMEGFSSPVRTLDALHLASMLFLVRQGQRVRLASYDRRLNEVAQGLGIPPYAESMTAS
jgi:predicted nucleic acid-binding protein